MKRRIFSYVAAAFACAILSCTSLTPLDQQTSAQQPGNCRTFPETSKSVCGRFLQYWLDNGGLPQQGYPISNEIAVKSDTDGKMYIVQYFERAVFEDHPQNQLPYDVLLQLLGAFRYKDLYPGSGGAPNQNANSEPGAERFPQTSKTVGGKFLDYWEKNGGLAQFGYPISDEFQEQSPLDGKTYTVQYFERAVFELHPENQPPYDVLLSQLGTFRWQTKQETQKPEIPAPEFRSDIPDGQYLPLYPGAIVKSVSVKEARYGSIRFVRYEVPEVAAKVIAFYDYVMPRYGWLFVYEINPLTRNSGQLESKYSWTDSKGSIPWHLQLDLQVIGGKGGGLSQVQFEYYRYPDADKIPLYSDAQDVQVHGGQISTPWPTLCADTVPFTSTTFLTAASSGDVESFYKSILSEYGWVFLAKISGSIQSAEGLQFQSDHELGFERTAFGGLWTIQRLNLIITAQGQVGKGALRKFNLLLRTCDFGSS